MNSIIVIVDLQKTGPFFRDPVLWLKFSLYNIEGQLIEDKKFNFEDYNKNTPEPVSHEINWPIVSSWITALEIKYPSDKYNIMFSSSIDISSVDYNLEKYANRLPVRYSSTGKLRNLNIYPKTILI